MFPLRLVETVRCRVASGPILIPAMPRSKPSGAGAPDHRWKLLSRLDHAAYLGRELARAEHALTSGELYVQGVPLEAASVRTVVASSPVTDN
jgi:uncharacterized protein DUF4346